MWNRYSDCFCCICVINIYIGTFIIIVSCSLSFTWYPWPIRKQQYNAYVYREVVD